MTRPLRAPAASLALSVLVACGATAGEGGGEPAARTEPLPEDRPPGCPAQAEAPRPLPGVGAEHLKLDYWLARTHERYGDPDQPLLDPRRIEDRNRALHQPHEDGRPRGQTDLLAPLDRDLLAVEVRDRLASLHERLSSGTYLDEDGEVLGEDDLEPFRPVDELPASEVELRVALAPLRLRCGPRVEGFYTESLDPDFDRNNCSTVQPQEVVQVLARFPGGMQLARTSYALGWIAADASLSPPLPQDLAELFVDGPREQAIGKAALVTEDDGARIDVPDGTLLVSAPDGDEGRLVLATKEGFRSVRPAPGASLRSTSRPLTRRSVLEEAFRLLDSPYGWGGHAGGRDCSRFLLDVLGRFGLELPRHSGRQALAGTFGIDVSEVESEREKLLLMDEAAKKGLVLLHFPGHIMLYLGRTEDGRPMAIHAFSEYVTPCEGTAGPEGRPLETLHRVDRVTVSDLELGRGSSRTAFIERITRVVVLGEGPGVELEGVAEMRPSAPSPVPGGKDRCDDSLDVAVFHSPAAPSADRPVRFIVTSETDARPVGLTLVDPRGRLVQAETHALGGPPWTWWAEVERPRPGRWTVLLADGERVEACERVRVHPTRPPAEPRAADAPAWQARWRWERDTENLFSAFVEQLFKEPVDDDVTWTSLQQLLADPERNLLYDHHGLGEDERLHLEPDCADLPYFLRAYFAWKASLPFAFRRCSRGRAGFPPACGETLHTHLEPVDGRDDAEAFRRFMRLLGSGVHSGSARTHPEAEHTDLYPVALDRAALRPGTVFADPYGHLLVIADWRPQGTDRYGVLMGADAQPDGTVGRRRFWQGSFLFTPDTTDVGAGFKRWRPVTFDGHEEAVAVLDNETLRGSTEHPAWSGQQYAGSAQDFYDAMQALINPRPLDPRSMQVALVDALEESVARRVNSVDNAVEFMNGRRWAPIEMPQGYNIFETSGPWEDFSTPSRDMRLLISVDAVTDFPDAVARGPERYGLEDEEEVTDTVSALRELLDEELSSRTFEYRRSDGSTWTLRLADAVDRAEALEMAYHPNDCVEIRWGAPKDSDEMATCDRHAPREHRARMRSYRDWFRERQRPPR